jgi:hypothetical protein
VFRPSAVCLLAFLCCSACRNENRNKQEIQDAIVQRLQTRSGLDLKALDMTTTSISFEKNKAYATVAFHPKGDPAVNSGMSMRYTLENKDGKWNVVTVGTSQGHQLPGHAATGADQLPPGHPQMDQMLHDQAGSGQLPPGHPKSDSSEPHSGMKSGEQPR